MVSAQVEKKAYRWAAKMVVAKAFLLELKSKNLLETWMASMKYLLEDILAMLSWSVCYSAGMTALRQERHLVAEKAFGWVYCLVVEVEYWVYAMAAPWVALMDAPAAYSWAAWWGEKTAES